MRSRAISRALLDSPRVTAAVASASSHAETAPTESVHEKWSSALPDEWSFFTKLMTYSGACEACMSSRLRSTLTQRACYSWIGGCAIYRRAPSRACSRRRSERRTRSRSHRRRAVLARSVGGHAGVAARARAGGAAAVRRSLPISPATSRHVSTHLAISRHISPHLATSRHISQVHMTFSGGFEEAWAEGEAREILPHHPRD